MEERERMNPRNTARIVGVLFIIGTVAGILSFVGMGPQATPDYLVNIAANANQVVTGALLVLIMGVAIAPIPAMLFPILKKYNESLALGYIVFRAIEVVTYIGIVLSWLLLVTLSQEYVQAGAPDATYYYTLGALVKGISTWIDPLLVIVFSISALILNYMFYRSKLIPRWLSGLGLFGATLHLGEGLLTLLGYPEIALLGIPVYLPIGIQEMIYAVWLIAKGFNPSALASLSPEQS
jgi:hypothetical protein